MELNARNLNENLQYFGHDTTEAGCQRFIDESLAAKADLDSLFKKSPNYNGNHQIVFDEHFERDLSYSEIAEVLRTFLDKVDAKKNVLKNKDENGKNLEQALAVGTNIPAVVDIRSLDRMENAFSGNIDAFDCDGITKKSKTNYNTLLKFFEVFKYKGAVTALDEDFSTRLTAVADYNNVPLKFPVGLKTGKAFNRVFNYYKFSGLKGYEKEFAKYSDLVAARDVKWKVVISTNPIDFLRMSFGVNWSSCHTTDPNNRRGIKLLNSNSYHGMYMNGCQSYALDNTSFIVYVVSESTDRNHPEEAGKIYRNMFQYKDGYLLQGRVYPQGKDGATDLYKKIRTFVQREIATCFGIEFIDNGTFGDTWAKCGGAHNKYTEIESYGHHYRDYNNASDCNMTRIKAIAPYDQTGEITRIEIGHESICLKCGRYESESSRFGDRSLTHSYCR